MTSPNLLLVVTDQHRGDCLGIDGHPVLSTPNLDQLGHEGARFRRAYSEAPSCIPARRTMISGLAPDRHGMVGFQHGVPWEITETLPALLTQAGYQTELIGKLHLYPPRKRFGFQRVQLADGAGGGANSDYADWLRRQGVRPPDPGAHGINGNGWVGRPSHLPEDQSHSYWCVDQALEFLARRDPTAPYFLCVSFIHPHPPLTPPQFYYDRYTQLDLPEPVVGDWVPDFTGPARGQAVDASHVRLDREAMRRCRAAYYGLINHVDDQLGRLLRRVKPDTFILFTSDHGEMLGDHHRFRKTYAYEGSARVPFLTHAPPSMQLPRNVVCDAPVGLQDVMPTLLDVAGIAPPAGITGRSVLPLIRGRSDNWREALHGEHAGCYEKADGMHYLVDSDTKYVWYSQTGQEHLFNLRADPHELHDLAQGPDGETLLGPWRHRLIARLRERPEGFTDGDRLIPGRPHEELVPTERVA